MIIPLVLAPQFELVHCIQLIYAVCWEETPPFRSEVLPASMGSYEQILCLQDEHVTTRNLEKVAAENYFYRLMRSAPRTLTSSKRG